VRRGRSAADRPGARGGAAGRARNGRRAHALPHARERPGRNCPDEGAGDALRVRRSRLRGIRSARRESCGEAPVGRSRRGIGIVRAKACRTLEAGINCQVARPLRATSDSNEHLVEPTAEETMEPIEVSIICPGWCGGIRAEICAAHPLVAALHVAEIRPERLAEVAAATRPRSTVADYRKLLDNDDIAAVFISATPETTHFPIARDCLLAGKHVF